MTLFKSEWCPTCKQVSPVAKQIAHQYPDKIEIKEIDIVKEPELATKNEILNVPTLIISKNNQVLDRINGFISKENLIRKLGL